MSAYVFACVQVGCFDPYSDDPRLGIQKISLCKYSNKLVVAGTAGQVCVYIQSYSCGLDLRHNLSEETSPNPNTVFYPHITLVFYDY